METRSLFLPDYHVYKQFYNFLKTFTIYAKNHGTPNFHCNRRNRSFTSWQIYADANLKERNDDFIATYSRYEYPVM